MKFVNFAHPQTLRGLIAAFLFNGTFLCGALLFLLRVIPDF